MLGDTRKCFILDGDVIRRGLNKDLGFTAEDRAENIRRISEVAKLFSMAGQICFVAFISPYSKDRDFGRKIHQEADIPFYECYVNASLDVCESRDIKGLYKKARAGEIKNFTGISDPYEAPQHPELDIKTGEQTVEQSVSQIMKHLIDDRIITSNSEPRVVDTLIESVISEADKHFFSTLKSLDIEVEQAEYIQTIGQGWAYPL
jgi:3'-phosphoadenosine 5'-phosphosulfate synthase